MRTQNTSDCHGINDVREGRHMAAGVLHWVEDLRVKVDRKVLHGAHLRHCCGVQLCGDLVTGMEDLRQVNTYLRTSPSMQADECTSLAQWKWLGSWGDGLIMSLKQILELKIFGMETQRPCLSVNHRILMVFFSGIHSKGTPTFTIRSVP